MLQATNLSVEYSDCVLFSQLHLQIQAGEVLQICGENGAGKTTLLRLLCGLMLPTEGAICWHGKSIQNCRADYLANLHYVSHQSAIKNGLTVYENLQMLQALMPVEPRMAFAQALEQARLNEYKDVLAGTLSAGQRRRLLLTKLALFPAMLWILDEPFASLDSEGIELLEQLIIAHVENNGMVILTSHQSFQLTGVQQRFFYLKK